MGSKQEEIREWLLNYDENNCNTCEFLGDCVERDNCQILCRKDVERILTYLDSQGVVIKIDREPPGYWNVTYCGEKPTPEEAYRGGQEDMQSDMFEAGYVAIEPLIGDKDEV